MKTIVKQIARMGWDKLEAVLDAVENRSRILRDEDIVGEVESGISPKEIGEYHGITHQAVGRILRNAKKNVIATVAVPETIAETTVSKVTGRKPKKRTSGIFLEDGTRVTKKEILAKIKDGSTAAQIAEKYGVSYQKIGHILRRKRSLGERLPENERTERNAAVVECIRNGATQMQASKKFEMSSQHVSRIWRDTHAMRGRDIRRGRWAVADKPKLEARNAAIAERVASGESKAALAKEYGMSGSNVYAIIRAAGG